MMDSLHQDRKRCSIIKGRMTREGFHVCQRDGLENGMTGRLWSLFLRLYMYMLQKARYQSEAFGFLVLVALAVGGC
jgi:hypothetical protein